ncbi:hypothetical protein M9458_050926, partial [Cirrhinus mrigala]
QEDKPLEQYVEEFLSVLHLVRCYQMELKDDQLSCSLTPDDRRRPVADFINYVLALNNSGSMSMWRILILPPSESTRTLQFTTSQLPPPAAPISLLPPFLPRFPQSSRAPPSSSAQIPWPTHGLRPRPHAQVNLPPPRAQIGRPPLMWQAIYTIKTLWTW